MDVQKIRKMAGLKQQPEQTLEENIEQLNFAKLNELFENKTLTEEQLQEGIWSGLKELGSSIGGAVEGAISGFSGGRWKAKWKGIVDQLASAQKGFDEITKGIQSSKWFRDLQRDDPKNAEAMKKLFDARKNAFITIIKDVTEDNSAIGAKTGATLDKKMGTDNPAEASKEAESKPTESKNRYQGFIVFGKDAKNKIDKGLKPIIGRAEKWSIKYESGTESGKFKSAEDLTPLNTGKKLYIFGKFPFAKNTTSSFEIIGVIITPDSGNYSFVTVDEKVINGDTAKNADVAYKPIAEKIWNDNKPK